MMRKPVASNKFVTPLSFPAGNQTFSLLKKASLAAQKTPGFQSLKGRSASISDDSAFALLRVSGVLAGVWSVHSSAVPALFPIDLTDRFDLSVHLFNP